MTHSGSIRPATTDDAAPVAELITGAFTDLAVCAWIQPDHPERTTLFRAFFDLWVDHALTTGTIETIEDPLGRGLAACAVWFPIDEHPSPPPDYPHWLDTLSPGPAERMRALDAFMETAHPIGVPHHYLLFLAVAPAWQDTGLGSALLTHHHDGLDRAGLPAYLESAGPRSRPLYQRHGYRTCGGPFAAPGQPTMFPMWRPPAPR